MDYTTKDWQDKPSRNTPILSTDLERMDQGIADAAAELDTKASFVVVATGVEARPDCDFVIWVGGTAAPVNMAAQDWHIPSSSTPDVTPPSVPTGLTASTVTDVGFTMSWNASTGNPSLYELFVSGVSAGTTANTTLSVTGKTPSTAHNVTVRARDVAGNWSAQSGVVVVTTAATADVVPPSVPTGLSSSAITATDFTVSWAPSTGAPTLYEVFIGGVSEATTATTSLTATGKTASTAYSVTVRARDSAGNWSAQSTPLVVTTGAGGGGGGDTTPPSVPANLLRYQISTTGFTVSWAPSTGTPTLYEVFVDGASAGTTVSTSMALTGKTPATAYNVTVRARDAAGNWSGQSVALVARTKLPAGVRASAGAVGSMASTGALTVLNIGDPLPPAWAAHWDSGVILIIQADNVTVDHYRFNSQVQFSGMNPTMSNCEVRCNANDLFGVNHTNLNKGVFTCTDCTIIGNGSGTSYQVNGISGDSELIAKRNDVSGTGDGIHAVASLTPRSNVSQNYVHDQSFVDEEQHLDGIQIFHAPSDCFMTVEHNYVGRTLSALGTPMNAGLTIGTPPGAIGTVMLTPVIDNNYFQAGTYHLRINFALQDIVCTNNDLGPVYPGEFGDLIVEVPTEVLTWSNNKDSTGVLIPNPNTPTAPTIRQSLQTSNSRTAQEILTTGAGTLAGDTLIILQCADAVGVLTPATSSAGTLVQIGTDETDGNLVGTIRAYKCPVTTDGAKTVTFPAGPGGCDIFGGVLVINGAAVDDGFAKIHYVSSVLTTFLTPSATLTGEADLFVVGMFNVQGSNFDLSASGLTQRCAPTAIPFSAMSMGTAVLNASGASPVYTVTVDTVAVAKPGVIAFGLRKT